MSARPTGTVTFLFTDIEGSTKRWEDQRELMAPAFKRQEQIMRDAIAKHNGYAYKMIGDAFQAAFASASDAMNAAITAQRALFAEPWGEIGEIRVRMGLHTGVTEERGDDYVGPELNRVARLMSAGHGGQVLLSQTTRDLIYQDLPAGVTLRDMGMHLLKDVRYPQQIYQLVMPDLLSEFPPLKTLAAYEEPPRPGAPPFKGLQYFDEADADLFFGRAQVTAKLAGYVRHHRFLAVIGASGSGKSSIVRAGLIPALRRDPTPWQIHTITPTVHPLESLAVSLTRHSESVTAAGTLADDLAREARSLRLYIQKQGDRVLLIVDQFEELFTLCRNDDERRAFVDNLLNAVEGDASATTVVITLRADFYEHLAHFAALRQAVSKNQEYIGPMSTDELRQAIEEPAKRGKWEFASGVVDLLLRDVGTEPGALPLLSHALLETWKRRRGSVMTFNGYAEAGGVRGAIARTAENVFHQELTPEQQTIARGIFLRLTELGEGTQDTRRRVARSELIPPAPSRDAILVEQVLVKLADARLVTTSEGSVEVAHEALIREWTRLREWLAQDREGLRLHRHLTDAAREWERLGREPGSLYRGTRLGQALEWAEQARRELNLQEWSFLEASKKLAEQEEAEREAQRQRELIAAQKLAEAERRRATILRGVAIGASVLLVVMIGLALFAFSQRTVAENARVEAVAQRDSAEKAKADAEYQRQVAFTRELSVNAQSNLDIDPERSILLALQAVSVSSAGGKPVLREAEEALHRAVMTSRLRMTLRGHTGTVHTVTFSPDGKRIATASQDKTAKIWDAATGRELLTLTGHADRATKVAFSPDGKRLALACLEKRAVKVWDISTSLDTGMLTGKEVMTLQDDQEIWTLAFSPDGTRIATGCGNKIAKVRDAATGKLLFTLPCNAPGTHSIAYSPDGRRIALRDVEMTAKVYDAETGRELLALDKPEAPNMLVYIAYSPDGKQIATATYEGEVNVWDAMSGRALLAWTARPNNGAVAFERPFGTRLFTGHLDGTTKVWDISTSLNTGISSASIQGAGSTTVPSLFTLAGHVSSIWSLAVSPDGRELVTASWDSTARIWDITDRGTSEWLTISDGACCWVFYSPDGKRLIGTSRINTSLFGANKVNVWDAATGQIIRTIDTGQIGGLSLSRDGKRIVTVTCKQDLSHKAQVGDRMVQVWDNMAQVWDVDTGNQLFSVPNPNVDDPYFGGYGAAFNPDGARIATATGKGNITIWDINSGKEVMTLSGHTSNVNWLAYSPDGTRLASSADTVKIWDALSGKELRTLPARLYGLTFSPDGTRLATAGDTGTAMVWEVATGKELQTLRGHTGSLFSVAFSPDGNRLATGSQDLTVKIWNVSPRAKTDEQPLTLYGGSNPVIYAQFSPDGKRLVAGWSYRGAPGSVRVYALDLEDILAIAKSRVTRALTTDECRKYLHVEQCPNLP